MMTPACKGWQVWGEPAGQCDGEHHSICGHGLVPVKELPKTVMFDYTCDGKTMMLSKDEFMELQRVIELITLLDTNPDLM